MATIPPAEASHNPSSHDHLYTESVASEESKGAEKIQAKTEPVASEESKGAEKIQAKTEPVASEECRGAEQIEANRGLAVLSATVRRFQYYRDASNGIPVCSVGIRCS